MTFSSDYTVPKMIRESSIEYGDLPAQQVRHKDGTFTPPLPRSSILAVTYLVLLLASYF